MLIPFLLFLITILLISIFWELSKINGRLKKGASVGEPKAAVPAKTIPQ